MRRLFTLGAAAMLAVPASAFAQDTDPAMSEAEIGALADTLRDPQVQAQAADTLGALSQVLLAIEIAPFIDALEQATGEPFEERPGGETLRDIAPEADELPETIERELPRAMDRMAGMGDALTTLLPALRDMARQFERIAEDTAISVR